MSNPVDAGALERVIARVRELEAIDQAARALLAAMPRCAAQNPDESECRRPATRAFNRGGALLLCDLHAARHACAYEAQLLALAGLLEKSDDAQEDRDG